MIRSNLETWVGRGQTERVEQRPEGTRACGELREPRSPAWLQRGEQVGRSERRHGDVPPWGGLFQKDPAIDETGEKLGTGSRLAQ